MTKEEVAEGLALFHAWWDTESEVLLGELVDGFASEADVALAAHGEGFRVGAAWEREGCVASIGDTINVLKEPHRSATMTKVVVVALLEKMQEDIRKRAGGK